MEQARINNDQQNVILLEERITHFEDKFKNKSYNEMCVLIKSKLNYDIKIAQNIETFKYDLLNRKPRTLLNLIVNFRF